jgi:hypothetical protein
MADLASQLRATIRNLEAIRDKQTPLSQGILDQIDALYKQKIALDKASIDSASQKYREATDALAKAVQETKDTIGHLERVEQTIATVAVAVQKIAALLKLLARA